MSARITASTKPLMIVPQMLSNGFMFPSPFPVKVAVFYSDLLQMP